MSTLSVRLPESLHKRLKEMAEKEGVSMNQLITLAISEKVSTLLTVDYLKERAQRGDRKSFDELLEKVPDREPEEFDKL
ncbi:MAG: toxin-antitoxin system HicB family antitoxin [Balneolaceae bacterium]|nr:toxin-antitoxin system HicB family antitoxin [Balneolaceae bacterium]MCH8548818.1 type II toxin-antitoxin system HicB family antitoxin [Balneolaceae bacterium]